MIHYTISSAHPASHYIDIEILITDCKGMELELQLPAWRPGRYELGNFAKNIKKFEALDVGGNKLPFTKKSKDLWVIKSSGASMVKARYSYFASEVNAGSSFVDDTQLYMNPVNCCMYVPGRMNEEHVITLSLPENYMVAASLRKEKEHELHAKDFHELADSPFIASPTLKKYSYFAKDLPIHIHIQGECKVNEEKLLSDFKKFSDLLLEFFGDAPVSEYHFIFQVLPHKFYHGVEHLNSTVIAIGPGYNFMHGKTYEEVLGVSCHEMFHLWNIKTIRPAEMQPYDYTKENYARTGYVYEGFTTYYGDLLLLHSKVFSEQEYYTTLEERLNKHFHNYGRFNLSVADSSFDNWLDGYVPGAPYRKVSIYDEGNLIALMLDVLIIQNTGGRYSLQDVMRKLYKNFGLKNKGYTEQDIISLINETAGTDLNYIFTKYVYGSENYEAELEKCFDHLGLKMEPAYSTHFYETHLGFKAVDHGMNKKVSVIAPDSPAWHAGLSVNDEIISVNGKFLKHDLNEWLTYYGSEGNELNLHVVSGSELKEIKITPSIRYKYFPHYKINKQHVQSPEKLRNFSIWSKH